jgi:hypothetical protein
MKSKIDARLELFRQKRMTKNRQTQQTNSCYRKDDKINNQNKAERHI